jgi:hypothetical protein
VGNRVGIVRDGKRELRSRSGEPGVDGREHALRERSLSRRARAHRQLTAILGRLLPPARQGRSAFGSVSVRTKARADSFAPIDPQSPNRKKRGCNDRPSLVERWPNWQPSSPSSRTCTVSMPRRQSSRASRGDSALSTRSFRRSKPGAVPVPELLPPQSQCFRDILRLQIRIQLQNLRRAHAVGHHLDDHGNGDPESADARGPTHLIGADRDAGEPWRRHPGSLSDLGLRCRPTARTRTNTLGKRTTASVVARGLGCPTIDLGALIWRLRQPDWGDGQVAVPYERMAGHPDCSPSPTARNFSHLCSEEQNEPMQDNRLSTCVHWLFGGGGPHLTGLLPRGARAQ